MIMEDNNSLNSRSSEDIPTSSSTNQLLECPTTSLANSSYQLPSSLGEQESSHQPLYSTCGSIPDLITQPQSCETQTHNTSSPSVPPPLGTRHYCSKCDKNFNSEGSLSTHLEYHTDNLINMWMNEVESSNRDEQQDQNGGAAAGSSNSASNTPACSSAGGHAGIMSSSISDSNSSNPQHSFATLLKQEPTDYGMNPPSVGSSNIDSAGIQHSNSLNTVNYSGQSPMHYDFNATSPEMPSPNTAAVAAVTTMVPSGPSSLNNTAGYPQQSPKNFYTDFHHSSVMPPQQSPGMNQAGHHMPTSQGSQYHYNGPSTQNQFDEYYIRSQLGRFHPYTRSPAGSPTMAPVKEEPKTENVILDLDSQQRFVGNGSRTAVPQLSAEHSSDSNPPIWNPINHQHSHSSMVSNGGSSNMNLPPPNTIQHVNSSMYAGGMISQGYPSPTPPNYLAQGYAPPVASPSPNYMVQSPSPNSPVTHPATTNIHAPPGDMPPTDCASNVKRAKNFKCEICRKWFTSQGHLKRHYGTALHKNMVKQDEDRKASIASSTTPSSQTSMGSTSQTQLLNSSQDLQPPSTLSPLSFSSQVTSPAPALGESALTPPQDIRTNLPPLPPVSSEDSNSSSHQQSLPPYQMPSFTNAGDPVSSTPSSIYSSVPSYQPQYTQSHHYVPIHHQTSQYGNPHISSHHSIQHQQNNGTATSSSFSGGSFDSNTNSSTPFVQTPLSSNNNGTDSAFFLSGSTPMIRGGPQNPVTSAASGMGFSSNNSGGESREQSPSSMVPYSSPVGGYHSNSDFPSDILDNMKLSEYCDINVSGMTSYSINPSPSDRQTPVSPMLDNKSPDASRDSTGSAGSHDSMNAVPSSVGSSFKCDDCNKTFNKMCYLTQHRTTYHDGEKPFKCEKCGKKFQEESTFEEHKAKHAGNKPFKCSQCPKQFNHKTDLRRHNCLHTGEKPFSCSICSKGFIRKDHMLKHMTTHKKKQAAANAAAAAAAAANSNSNNGMPPTVVSPGATSGPLGSNSGIIPSPSPLPQSPRAGLVGGSDSLPPLSVTPTLTPSIPPLSFSHTMTNPLSHHHHHHHPGLPPRSLPSLLPPISTQSPDPTFMNGGTQGLSSLPPTYPGHHPPHHPHHPSFAGHHNHHLHHPHLPPHPLSHHAAAAMGQLHQSQQSHHHHHSAGAPVPPVY